MVLVWVALAFAVLAKGLVGIVLPGLALAIYAAIERDLSIVKGIFTLRGIVLFLAITLPWFILVQRANPEFFDLFFVQEHFRRYLQPGHHRPGPWWYFLPIAALGLPAVDGRAAGCDARCVERAAPGLPQGRAIAAGLGRRRDRLLQRLQLQAADVHPAGVARDGVAHRARVAGAPSEDGLERRDREHRRRCGAGGVRHPARQHRQAARARRRTRGVSAVPHDGRRRARRGRRARGGAAKAGRGDCTNHAHRGRERRRAADHAGRNARVRRLLLVRAGDRHVRRRAANPFRRDRRSTASACWTRASRSTSGVR